MFPPGIAFMAGCAWVKQGRFQREQCLHMLVDILDTPPANPPVFSSVCPTFSGSIGPIA